MATNVFGSLQARFLGSSEKKDGTIIRKLYGGSVVSIIIAAVAAMFGILIDGIIISKFLGTESMAAYGLITPLTSIVTALSGVLGAGAQVFCANYLGKGDVDRARKVFSACMFTTVLSGVIIIVVLFLFCEPVCIAIGAKGSAAGLLPLTKDYLYGIAPGIVAVMLLFVFNSLMRLDGDATRVIYAVVAMTVVDIVGDLVNALLIHGGMLGMGISTAISYYVALIILLFHFRKPDIIFRFSLKDVSPADIGNIFKTGAPSAAGSAATMVRNTILNLIMVGVAGSVAVAALSVRTTLNMLFGSILMGVGMTTTMIAGIVSGEEDRTSAKHLMNVSLKYAIGMGALLGAFVFFAAPMLANIFSSGKEGAAEMVAYSIRALRIYAIGLPMYGINMVFVYYLQGIGKLKMANIITLLDNLVYVVLIALLLSPVAKVDAIWVSYPIGEALVLLTLFLLAFREKKAVPTRTEDYLFLPKEFGASEDDTYECSLLTVDEVMTAAHEISDFMKAHAATDKEAMLIPLCVEEMAKNVIEHGFTKDDKPHSVDLRVVKKNEDWIIRIRDNCKAFDPQKWMEIHHPEDPASNIGIRMVYGMASDVQHVNTMQLNNLIIKV